MSEPLDRPTDHRSTEDGIAAGWYIAMRSENVARVPRALLFDNTPLVAFRDQTGRPAILLDRCAHRNAPLSRGRVSEGRIQCSYHGWEYDHAGICRVIPGLQGSAEHPQRRVPSYACRDSQGWLWMYSEPDTTPSSQPYGIPFADHPRYLTIREHIRMPGPLDAVAENALDVPHTAFVHTGLFRGNKKRTQIDIVVRTNEHQVEAEYIGESRPKGLVGRLLSPGGGAVLHWDRFILPCIAQVEYRLAENSHIVTTAALTPRSSTSTDLFATVAVNVPLPKWLLRSFVKPIAMRIVRQDVDIVKQQTKQVTRFGSEQFVSTEIDVLGLRIKKMLRDAAHGRPPRSAEERRIKMLV